MQMVTCTFSHKWGDCILICTCKRVRVSAIGVSQWGRSSSSSCVEMGLSISCSRNCSGGEIGKSLFLIYWIWPPLITLNFCPTLQLYQTLKLRLFVLHHCNLHTGLGHSLQDSLSCASSCSPIAVVLNKHLVQYVLDTINAGICRSGLGGSSCTALW